MSSQIELKPIILYDIASITPGRPWSPSTMKTRYCLSYKKLPFTTIWVELPDIAALLQSKGVTEPPFTLPAIEDPNTGAFIMDSLAIAKYLDDNYPETAKVLSPAAYAVMERVIDMFSFGSGGAPSATTSTTASAGNNLEPRLVFLILAANRLNPVSKEHYHRARTARWGVVWTMLCDACSTGPEGRAECVRRGIEAMRESWGKITAAYDRDGDKQEEKSGGPFVLGEEPCFLDFSIAGRIKYILDGLVPSEVSTVTDSVEGGRLVKLVESLEKYYIC